MDAVGRTLDAAARSLPNVPESSGVGRTTAAGEVVQRRAGSIGGSISTDQSQESPGEGDSELDATNAWKYVFTKCPIVAEVCCGPFSDVDIAEKLGFELEVSIPILHLS